MSTAVVRRADRTDLPALVALRTDWQGPAPDSDFAQRFADWFDREGESRRWWLAKDGSTAVGMVNLKVIDRMPSPARPASSWGYLCNLYVRPEHRGSGTGTALVAALLDAAQADHLVRVVLHPSELSVPLYTRLGFTDADSLLVHDLD